MRFANTAMSLRPLYALRSLPPPTPLPPPLVRFVVLGLLLFPP